METYTSKSVYFDGIYIITLLIKKKLVSYISVIYEKGDLKLVSFDGIYIIPLLIN